MKKKSYIIIGIILPAFIIVFFSFEFDSECKYKVGIVDKDNSYASNEIIKTIDNEYLGNRSRRTARKRDATRG